MLEVPPPVLEDCLVAATATSPSFYPGWNFSNAYLFFNEVLTLVPFPEPAGMVLPGVPSVDSLFLDGRCICVLELL